MIIIQSPAEALFGLPVWTGYLLSFVIGSAAGSFLNVVIYRVPRGRSIVFPNSACPECEAPIKPYDNIPILGWILLGGKCRSCKQPISPRYPAIELLTAILFVVCFWRFGVTGMLPVALVFVSAMIALIFIDAGHMILPNVITYPLLAFSLLIRAVFPLTAGIGYFDDVAVYPLSDLAGQPALVISMLGALLGGLLGGGSLWLIGEIWKRLRGVDAMGLGDVKMMFAVGALLGWRLTFVSVFIGAFAGAVAGIALIAKDREKGLQAQIPFGVFLGIGSVVSMLFGSRIIEWYLENFLPR